jgi:hypothetical protein
MASNYMVNAVSGVVEMSECMDGTATGFNFEIMRGIAKAEMRGTRTSQLQFVKTKDRTVLAYEQEKLIADRFDKRRVLSTGKTLPWTSFNYFITNEIDYFKDELLYAEMCETFSNYLNNAMPEDIYDFMTQELNTCMERREFYCQIFQSWRMNYPVSFAFFNDEYPQF